jgi:hypothetical protein
MERTETEISHVTPFEPSRALNQALRLCVDPETEPSGPSAGGCFRWTSHMRLYGHGTYRSTTAHLARLEPRFQYEIERRFGSATEAREAARFHYLAQTGFAGLGAQGGATKGE